MSSLPGSQFSTISAATFRRIAEDKLSSAIEQGEFDNLPGLGKPSPLIDQPYHPLWWVMRKLQREQLLPRAVPGDSSSGIRTQSVS